MDKTFRRLEFTLNLEFMGQEVQEIEHFHIRVRDCDDNGGDVVKAPERVYYGSFTSADLARQNDKTAVFENSLSQDFKGLSVVFTGP